MISSCLCERVNSNWLVHCDDPIWIVGTHNKNGRMHMALGYPVQQESCANIGVLARMQKKKMAANLWLHAHYNKTAEKLRMPPPKTRRCRTSQHWSLLSPTRSRSLHLSFSTAKVTRFLEAANTVSTPWRPCIHWHSSFHPSDRPGMDYYRYWMAPFRCATGMI
jgi:hypothetical protein